MKAILPLMTLTLAGLTSFAQLNADSSDHVAFIAAPIDGTSKENVSIECNSVIYRLLPTQNMWTFIKLNTRNGQMWQVQFDVAGSNRFETSLSSTYLVALEEEKNGRFTLYPTENIYNFILLDQIDGKTWQVQWSTDPESRGIIPIE